MGVEKMFALATAGSFFDRPSDILEMSSRLLQMTKNCGAGEENTEMQKP
jgi:hypothetical protein